MKKIICSLFLLFLFNSFASAQNSGKTLYDNFFGKDSVVILVTDSGLGGLSIASEFYERLKSIKLFRKADVIFFNAQPHLSYGYNSMKSTEEKVWVFENALKAMEEKFHPDIILIGCNTLSVIYEYTNFSKHEKFPVMDIVDTGVELIKSNMDAVNNAKVIIFATETTVGEGKHKSSLIDSGISENRIVTVACPKLAGSIERDFESAYTDSLVTDYVKKAESQIGQTDEKILVSYNCTHYGYVDKLFRNAFAKDGTGIEKFLNPNPYMLDKLLGDRKGNFENPGLSIKVYSQPELTPERIASIYSIIEKSSVESAEALLYYEYVPDFFEWHYEK